MLHACRMFLPRSANIGVGGLNGAGKTTLFMAIAGALRSASVAVDAAVRAIAWLPQDLAMPPGLTVREYCQLVVRTPCERIIGLRPDELLSHETGRRRMAHLSRGERQYLAAMFALYSGAEIVLLDEPFSALDLRRRCDLIEEIRSRTGPIDSGIVMVASQDIEALSECSDHFVLIQAGIITFAGRPLELLTGPTADLDERERKAAVRAVIEQKFKVNA